LKTNRTKPNRVLNVGSFKGAFKNCVYKKL